MEKLIITKKIDIDSLNNRSLKSLISYLKELQEKYGKEATLVEDWWGYEDFGYTVQFDEEESNEDYEARIAKLLEDSLKKENNAKVEKERSRLRAEITRLQKEIVKLK